jgi:hypothetical protein
MRNFYIPMRGSNWREASHRSNRDSLNSNVDPTLDHVALKDLSKFQA